MNTRITLNLAEVQELLKALEVCHDEGMDNQNISERLEERLSKAEWRIKHKWEAAHKDGQK